MQDIQGSKNESLGKETTGCLSVRFFEDNPRDDKAIERKHQGGNVLYVMLLSLDLFLSFIKEVMKKVFKETKKQSVLMLL